MTVIRIHKKEKNFLVLDKACIKEKTLSWGAKGIHTYLLSLPEDWKVRVNDLQNRSANGRDAVRNLLKELEEAGYLSKEWIRDEETGKYIQLEYVIYETPHVVYEDSEPHLVSPQTDNPSPVKPTLINNNINKNKIKKAAVEENICLPQKPIVAASNFPRNNFKNLNAQPQDAVIGYQLTANQLSRIDEVISNLSLSPTYADEIAFCLLSSKHFKGCGQDFYHKLNSIRLVIRRGEWQTPTEMVLQAKAMHDTKLHELEQALQMSYSEINGLNQLIQFGNQKSKRELEILLKKEKVKMALIKKSIDAFYEEHAVLRLAS